MSNVRVLFKSLPLSLSNISARYNPKNGRTCNIDTQRLNYCKNKKVGQIVKEEEKNCRGTNSDNKRSVEDNPVRRTFFVSKVLLNFRSFHIGTYFYKWDKLSDKFMMI